jgi:glycosyltransferase involved in cell wall biosynthesis
MEVDIKVSDLKDKKLMVATPMYGGQCAGMFCKATNDLAAACAIYGISLKFYYLFNESLITRARNYCVDEFLRSDCDYLMFIDSDIGFDYKDVLTLLHFAGRDEYDIITAPYPKKTIAWEKVKAAVDRGYANDNPFHLQEFVGDYVFNPVDGIKSFSVTEPVEIKEGGTGFMMIPRKTFEKYDEAYPELKYIPDHARTESFDGSREIMCYFDTVIDPESKRYLSEDYMFSQYARKAGMKIWMFPWMKLKHVGSYIFGGSMQAMAAIGASPTASKKSNAKNYLTDKPKDAKVAGMNRKQRRAAQKGK